VRRIAAAPRGHGLLDLAAPPALRPGVPGALGLGRGHPAQLAHGRPTELTPGERLVEQRQRCERATDPEPLFGLPAVQPDDSLRILPKARVAAPRVHAEPLGRQQPATDLALVARAFGAERDDPRVN